MIIAVCDVLLNEAVKVINLKNTILDLVKFIPKE